MPIDKESYNMAAHKIACVRRGCDQTLIVPADEALPDQWVEAQGWAIAHHHRTQRRTYYCPIHKAELAEPALQSAFTQVKRSHPQDAWCDIFWRAT